MNRNMLTAAGLLVGFALLIVVNIFAGTALRSVRADLTEKGLYSLSPGTRNILRELDEAITLRFYFSKKLASSNPGIAAYAQRVQELLEEYATVAGGQLSLQVIEPEPFSALVIR